MYKPNMGTVLTSNTTNTDPVLTSNTGFKPRASIGLDFETWGSRPLPTVGLDNYVSDPQFLPLMAGVAYSHQPTVVYDFILEPDCKQNFINVAILAEDVGAHNAAFEDAVLTSMGVKLSTLVDTAAVARILGASSRLEFAAAQLLGRPKLEQGKDLMKLFSMGAEPPTREFVKAHYKEWEKYKEYCARDAELSLELMTAWPELAIRSQERTRWYLTHRMNQAGWKVDIPLVKEMQARYLENCDALLADFQRKYDPKAELNLGSPIQLKRWCEARGIKASSFDEQNVADMIARISKRLDKMKFGDERYNDYYEVLHLLTVKQNLGGSSLSKLPKILDLVGEDGVLRNQYMHCGAGQTYRTSGVGVQMQNLKRLNRPMDVTKVYDRGAWWTNDDLAGNLRQVFTAHREDGFLIVSDLSSIESRALAYLAGEQWKLDEYAKGRDMYRVLGAKMAGLTYEEVPKDSEERRTGKVGELSCGYNAGAGAVQSFAKGMGIELSEIGAQAVVTDWRDTNPKIVAWWQHLQDVLERAMDPTQRLINYSPMIHGLAVRVQRAYTPSSLRKQHLGCSTLEVSLVDLAGVTLFTRIFQGVYRRGRDLCYHKPAETVGGMPWKNSYVNPKTKRTEYYKIYGGKLAGILTQSFCRELFFRGLERLAESLPEGMEIIGQFHDEIVVDWNPDCPLDIEQAKLLVKRAMVSESNFPGLPMDAEVKHDYRYTK